MAITKINKSSGGLLRSNSNLQLLFGSDYTGRKTGERISLEHNICCGLGRKILYFSKGSGTPVTIKKYPVTFNGTQYLNKTELAQAINESFGVGYVVYISGGNVVVIGAQYRKKSDGTLDLPDYITIS